MRYQHTFYFATTNNLNHACTTPDGKAIFESGAEYLELTGGGHGYLYPQSKFRFGLPWDNEILIIFPNNNTNSVTQTQGASATELAFKHSFGYTEHWISAVRAIYIPPSGNPTYGTAKAGYTINGILSYRYKQFNASAMLSGARLSTSVSDGSKYYNTFDPDFTVGWQVTKWLQPYAEFYGQTHTAPGVGSGFNLDTGLLFLFNKNFEADVEFGHRLSGHLGNFNNYYGAGFSFMF